MTDAAEFEVAEAKRVSVPCKVCTFLADRADRDVYTTEFAKPVAVRSQVAIHRVLVANGFVGDINAVKRHRSNHVR